MRSRLYEVEVQDTKRALEAYEVCHSKSLYHSPQLEGNAY